MANNEFFEEKFASAGRQVGRGADQVVEGASKIGSAFWDRIESTEDKSDAALDISIVDYFLSRMGTEIEMEPIDSSFEYADILSWAKKHYKGNQLYLIKGIIEKSNSFIICAFFALDDKPFLSKNDAKKCFICKTIPSCINDLFGTKNIYVQPLK